jgi:Tfp pilus assembly protein PilX
MVRFSRAIAVRHRGAVLTIVLVLLLLIAIVGTAGLGTARLGLSLAGNVQAREQAFRLAQAGIDQRLASYRANRGPLASAPDCPAAGAAMAAVETTGSLDGVAGRYTTRLCFLGTDGGLITGSSTGQFVTARYELQADARTAARDARSVLVQGFELLQPTGGE